MLYVRVCLCVCEVGFPYFHFEVKGIITWKGRCHQLSARCQESGGEPERPFPIPSAPGISVFDDITWARASGGANCPVCVLDVSQRLLPGRINACCSCGTRSDYFQINVCAWNSLWNVCEVSVIHTPNTSESEIITFCEALNLTENYCSLNSRFKLGVFVGDLSWENELAHRKRCILCLWFVWHKH